MKTKGHYTNQAELAQSIAAARGEVPADTVLKGGHYLDVFTGAFVAGDVAVFADKIVGVGEAYEGRQVVDATGLYMVPGFIDSHVHIESSMMTPPRFQEVTLPCGTTSAIWDPHEIANVKGVEGIEWALRASENLLMDVFVMVPSCVPSTSLEMGFETSGASLFAKDLRAFRDHPRVLGLAEMMNFPGLLNGDEDVLTKLGDFQAMKRDGHCPGLTGKDLNAYGVAGIHSCHESTSLAEAREKLRKGLHVLVREGSCAKDAEALLPLIDAYSSAVVGLCSDDRNPLDIADQGHINFIINLALRRGLAPEDIFRAASFAPARAYGLEDRGAIAPGYLADFVVVEAHDSWRAGMSVRDVFKSGQRVREVDLPGVADLETPFSGANIFMESIDSADLQVTTPAQTATASARVIGVIPGQIVTDALRLDLSVSEGAVQADQARDVLKIAVFERHHNTGHRSVGFVQGFRLRAGAIATSINHDSHNVITVGASDEAIVQAVNEVKRIDGGIVVVDSYGKAQSLSLPIGGLMSPESPDKVADAIATLKQATRDLGCELEEPFLTLSFLALPVIPQLKITDRGLVDVDAFQLVPCVSAT